MKRLSLPSGTQYSYDNEGNKICTGSSMGRRNVLPDDVNAPAKLQLKRLKWVDGDYDEWGAYWGYSFNDDVYCAWGDVGDIVAFVFVRAKSRDLAKTAVREKLPNARFYR